MTIEAWNTRLALRLDYSSYLLVEPLYSVFESASLQGLFALGAFAEPVVVELSRSVAFLARLLFTFGLMRAKKERVGFSLGKLYSEGTYLHDSTVEYSKNYAVSVASQLAGSNLEKANQIKFLSLEDLGRLSMVGSLVDNINSLCLYAYQKIVNDVFLLKFNQMNASSDEQEVSRLKVLINSFFFKTLKYVVYYHQMLLLYAWFILRHQTTIKLLGKNYGNPLVVEGIQLNLLFFVFSSFLGSAEGFYFASLKREHFGEIKHLNLISTAYS